MKRLSTSILTIAIALGSVIGGFAQCCNVYTDNGLPVRTIDGTCVTLAYATSDCAMMVGTVMDADGDGVADVNDMCPQVKGPLSNNGCPEINAGVWEKFDAALADVHFAVNSDSLMEGSHAALGMIASLMEANKDYTLKVSGYADSTGTESYNKVLSEKRAVKVKEYLISKGVPANRIILGAYGEKMPVANNGTAYGRSKNRRVEFDLINR